MLILDSSAEAKRPFKGWKQSSSPEMVVAGPWWLQYRWWEVGRIWICFKANRIFYKLNVRCENKEKEESRVAASQIVLNSGEIKSLLNAIEVVLKRQEYQKLCFECCEFEMFIRHLSRDVKWTIFYVYGVQRKDTKWR